MNKKFVGLIIIILVALGAYYFLTTDSTPVAEEEVEEEVMVEEEPAMMEEEVDPLSVIGTSVEERNIEAYRYGTGDKTVVLVGAIHGGYEWNSALLAYDLVDHFAANEDAIPQDISVVVIPVANPDGLAAVVGTSTRFAAEDAPQFDFADEVSLEDTVVAGRFNANGVDLNRNFACKWQADAVWRENDISGGTEVFSEPEAKVLRDFFLAEQPAAVVFYHSASSGVYTSFCEGDALPVTVDILAAYAEASEYERFDDYPYYEVTGDAADWLSTVDIPAISVELSTHDVIEFDRNVAGVEAMFDVLSDADAMMMEEDTPTMEDTAMEGEAVVIDVVGTNFAFDVEEIRVKEGDTVTINFESAEGFHDWVVDAFRANTEQVRAGGKTTVTFVADAAGTYEYYCSVGNHREQGMVGTLIVE